MLFLQAASTDNVSKATNENSLEVKTSGCPKSMNAKST